MNPSHAAKKRRWERSKLKEALLLSTGSSHRAQLARKHSSRVDFELAPGDTFVAWAPMFHMASTDQSIHVLCLGGK
jgi:hypothetical protein